MYNIKWLCWYLTLFNKWQCCNYVYSDCLPSELEGDGYVPSCQRHIKAIN